MSKIVSTIIFFSLAATAQAQTAGEATIRLTGTTLMHEMRATPRRWTALKSATVPCPSMAAASRPQHPAQRTGRCGREHPQKRNRQKQATLLPALLANSGIQAGNDCTSRDALAVLQPQTGFDSGHMVLAIRLCYGRKDRMERYAAIYGKEQSPEVLPARTGCRT